MQITTRSGIACCISFKILQFFPEERLGCLYSLHILPELGSALRGILLSVEDEVLYGITTTGVLIAYPWSDTPLEVKSPNGLSAWLSPLACGYLASLIAYSSLAYASSPGLCLLANRKLVVLGEEARGLSEWHVIRTLLT